MWRVLAVAGALTVLSGCGGGGAQPSHTGAALFRHECASCHSLLGNESLRRQGGDLLGFHFSREVWLQYAREMPVRHKLTAAQLGAVVDYIRAVQRAS